MIASLLAGGVYLLPLAAFAYIPENHPYKSIVDRNSFGLLPPTPPQPVNVPPPPSNVKLTGISTLFGVKKAMLMVQDSSGPGKTDKSVILPEGQKEDQIEVISIDEKAGIVKIKNAGVVSDLSFEANGVKLPSLPTAAAARPGNAIPAPPSVPGAPSPTMTGVPQPRPASGLRQIPTRHLRLPSGRTIGGSSDSSSATPPEVQQILMEANRDNPDQPPLPPTELSDMLGTSPQTISADQ